MSIRLVLGGGGARCLAHIGVLRALEERGISVGAVAACSTGAFIGALVAAGYPSEAIKEAFDTNLLGLLSASNDTGLLDQENVAEHFSKVLPSSFKDLQVPFAAVATDLQKGVEVVLKRGPLIPALCASNAVPGLFDPVTLGGRDLMDGGVLNMVPVDVVQSMGDGPTLAIEVSLPKDEEIDLHKGRGVVQQTLQTLKGKTTLPIDLTRKAYVISQSWITETRLAQHPPDLLIRPTFPKGIGVASFGDLEQIVQLGYETAQQRLAESAAFLES